MPLIATPGSATANSFVSLAVASSYLVGRPDLDAWNAALPSLKDIWLQRATALLSRRVGWLGARANPLALVAPIVQALPLPMVGQVDAYGEALALDIIPPLVQEATALLALALAQEHAEAADESPARQGIQRIDVPQQVSVTFRDPAPTVSPRRVIPWEVWDLLRLYGRVPVRGRHMPVVRGQG